MKIKQFIFSPDNHYGYPESEEGSSPYSISDLIETYANAGYGAYYQGDYMESEPDRRDFDEEAEYEEALAEWEDNEGSNKEDAFYEYGNFDLYYNSYIIFYDPNINNDVDPDSTLNRFFDYDSTSCHDDFMVKMSEEKGVIMIISNGAQNELGINGSITPLSSSVEVGGDYLAITQVIASMVKSGNILDAGKIYTPIVTNLPWVDDKLKEILTSEEYIELTNSGKGSSIMGRYK